MKNICRFVTLTLMLGVLSLSGFAQKAPAAAKPLNLVRGVVGPVGSNTSWSGFSALNLIGGAGVIPVLNNANTTVFYLGFTAGATADVNNLVLYTTPRGRLNITAVTPVKLGGVSNPSIALSNPTVCPVAPSAANPCIVRLDPLVLPLSPLSDYYLVVYFTSNDSNNSAVGATQPHFNQSSLNGGFVNGDESRLTVGQNIPTGITGIPDFLMFVMTN
jgi:hypothetical protein